MISKEKSVTPIDTKLIEGVETFKDCADRSFLNILRGMDRDDIQGQATIRYLIQIKHWPFTQDSEFAELLEHFFGSYVGRKSLPAEEYQKKTFDMIKDAWNYECVVPVVEPKEPIADKPKAGKRAAKPKMVSENHLDEEGESGSKTFKSINQAASST
jgi:hypothetical protein